LRPSAFDRLDAERSNGVAGSGDGLEDALREGPANGTGEEDSELRDDADDSKGDALGNVGRNAGTRVEDKAEHEGEEYDDIDDAGDQESGRGEMECAVGATLWCGERNGDETLGVV